jgi:NADH-quinone oxidoreductase subunit N
MPPLNLIAILPEIILSLFACAVFVIDPFVSREKKHLIGYFSLVALLLTGLALIPLSGSNLTAFSGMILLDAYAIFFKGLLLITSAIVVAMSILYLQIERINIGEYYGLILFSTVGMLLLPGASDLLSIYLSLELMSMSFYILTAFMRKSPRSVEAGIKYFLTGIFTSGIILYGAAFLYGLTGNTHLGSIRAYLSGTAPTPTLILAMVLLLAGFGFKIAAIPFHMWAPDVYDGAPTPITSLLSTGSKIAALAAMVRFFVVGLPVAPSNTWQVFWLISVLTMTIGNIAALLQTNVKRLLAYSSVAQTGYLLIGLVVPSGEGLSAILIYSVAYTFMTLGAFATLVLLCKKDRRGDQISDFAGFARLHPAVAAAFVVFALSLVGIPPTAGFIGKLFLFQAAIAHEFYWLAIFGILNSAISLYYYFKIIVAMYMENRSGEIAPSFSRPLTASLVITSLATLLIGLYPEPLIRAAFASILVLR